MIYQNKIKWNTLTTNNSRFEITSIKNQIHFQSFVANFTGKGAHGSLLAIMLFGTSLYITLVQSQETHLILKKLYALFFIFGRL